MTPLDTNLRLGNAYGSFSDCGSEFIITNVHTPRPWVNVICNERYGLVVSQAGGGFSWLDNCQLQRITRWDQDMSADAQGRFIFIQDIDQPDDVWSTTYRPTSVKAETEQVRHGLGYSVFERLVHGIQSSHLVFVPLEDTAEIWIVELTNRRETPVNLRVASYLEWHLGGQGDWHREFHRLFMETQTERGLTIAWKHPGVREGSREVDQLPFVAYHGLIDAEVESWIGDKAAFVGHAGTLDRPQALRQRATEKATGRWDDPIAAAQTELRLEPGQTCRFAFVLGAAHDASQARTAFRNLSMEQIDQKLADVRSHWAKTCSQTMVETPDASFDVLNNRWLKYQAIAGRMNARCAYYQQGGAFGYRDQLQDSLLCLTYDPKRTLSQLALHAEAMYEDGGVRHWWHPGFDIYVESHHSDTCLWLAYGVLAYLDETNDLGRLFDIHRYLRRDTQQFGAKGSLFEHAMRGIDRTLSRLSPRGLPLIGAGDWNDGLSHAGIDGKGESVWLAMFLYGILQRWRPILLELGETARAESFASAAAQLQQAVNEHGWDGEWFLAGTRDDGLPFGSRVCQEGRLFLNPQTWSVITGIAPDDRAAQALDAVSRNLLKPYGALLLTPAYSSPDPYIGYITRYAPGLRENGGVYMHASTWAVQAYAMMGEYERAYEIYKSMCPPDRAADPDRYWAEPYVMPGNVDGPDSPHEGRAGWTWYTGSAAWMHRVALDWICGVRAQREGLLIEATGPWEEYRVVRKFRGDTYDIAVRGEGPIQGLTVDGHEHTGPLTGPGVGITFKVEVERS